MTKNEEDFSESVIADLHIHSRFARATSKDITLKNLEKWARIKGINLLGTGDFQHPQWSQELKELEEHEGILYSKTGFKFLLQTEISLAYTQDGKGRRVHHVILSPNKEIAEQITKFFLSRGRIDYDGRPIFGMSTIDMMDSLLSIDKRIIVFPAHVWTSWFGALGSKSGFDSLEDCYKDKANYVYALETGMSSDPLMNYRLSKLDKYAIVSFSDIHSFWPWRLGREATIFEKADSYEDILKAFKNNEIKATIETPPEYGKYHYDGHRLCKFSCSPEESRRLKGICPVCGKPLTIGVDYRVEELADRPLGFTRKNAKPFYSLIPIHELIAFNLNTKPENKKTWQIYNSLIERYQNEFNILLNISKEQLLKDKLDLSLAELIIKNRQNKIRLKPGFDGEYGKIIREEKQTSLI